MDYKQTLLYDNTGEFKTREFIAWLNFVNLQNFKLRMGAGSLYLNTTKESFLLYGFGLDIIPEAPIRIEIWGNLTKGYADGAVRPRQEVGIRLHYDFWKKGPLNVSGFTGVSNQFYFNALNFPTFDLGLNYFLSFNKFAPKAE